MTQTVSSPRDMQGPPGRKAKRLIKRISAYWQIYLLILPAFIYLFVFNYIQCTAYRLLLKTTVQALAYGGANGLAWNTS